jgi:hypothetical protein
MLGGLAAIGRVALTGVVVWRNIILPFCSRTPVAELAGNPLLQELLIPSVFQIRIVAILDRAVPRYLKEHQLEVPAAYHEDGKVTPGGRIRFLSDTDRIINLADLRAARKRRNDLAHEEAGDITWQTFDDDAAAIEAALEQLTMLRSVDVVREFRRTARALADPVHRKHYLGAVGMGLAAIAEAYTTHLAFKASLAPVRRPR